MSNKNILKMRYDVNHPLFKWGVHGKSLIKYDLRLPSSLRDEYYRANILSASNVGRIGFLLLPKSCAKVENHIQHPYFFPSQKVSDYPKINFTESLEGRPSQKLEPRQWLQMPKLWSLSLVNLKYLLGDELLKWTDQTLINQWKTIHPKNLLLLVWKRWIKIYPRESRIRIRYSLHLSSE